MLKNMLGLPLKIMGQAGISLEIILYLKLISQKKLSWVTFTCPFPLQTLQTVHTLQHHPPPLHQPRVRWIRTIWTGRVLTGQPGSLQALYKNVMPNVLDGKDAHISPGLAQLMQILGSGTAAGSRKGQQQQQGCQGLHLDHLDAQASDVDISNKLCRK